MESSRQLLEWADRLNISRGKIPGAKSVFKYGQNNVVGATEEIIWDGGNGYTYLTLPSKMSIASDEDADTYNDAVGAWNVQIFGDDFECCEQSEIIQLDGTTPVVTEKEYIRIWRMRVLQAGNTDPIGGGNVGNITCTSVSGSYVQAVIQPTICSTLMAMYTIPTGYTGYVTGYSMNVGQGKEAVIKSKIRPYGANTPFVTIDTRIIYENSFLGNLETPLTVPEKSDLILTAQVSALPAITVNASFGLILISNDRL